MTWVEHRCGVCFQLDHEHEDDYFLPRCCVGCRCGSGDSRTAPLGVWRRAKWDWAYRVESPRRGSVYGCGFASRHEAVEAMREVSADVGA